MRRETLAIVLILGLLLAACGGGGDDQALGDGDEVTISMFEYGFDPAEIQLTPGTTVTIKLENIGGKDHEFMAGQEVHVEDGHPHGFESDFFDTVENLQVDPPDALEMEMEGMGDEMSSTTMGDMSSTTMGDMGGDEEEMEMEGVMVSRAPTETATITFTVTEASVGEWEIGCFEEDGTHWDEGMRGTIIVEEA